MKSSPLIIVAIVALTLCSGQSAAAKEIYRWTDDEGVIYFSHTPPSGRVTSVAYSEPDASTAYRWKDEKGHVHFSDIPPGDISARAVQSIQIEPFDHDDTDTEKYSIIEQAKQMAESRKQREKERLAGKKAELEEEKLAQEMEILRLNEFIRKHGYGPRPYYYPYSRQFHYNRPGSTYYSYH